MDVVSHSRTWVLEAESGHWAPFQLEEGEASPPKLPGVGPSPHPSTFLAPPWDTTVLPVKACEARIDSTSQYHQNHPVNRQTHQPASVREMTLHVSLMPSFLRERKTPAQLYRPLLL